MFKSAQIFTFFLPGFFFTNIHDYRTAEEEVRYLFKFLPTTFILFAGAYTLARRLLQRAHFCTELAAGLESGNFRAQVTNH